MANSYQVVVHVDEADPTRHQMALGNVLNLLADLGDQVRAVEVVANGPGLDMFVSGAASAPMVESCREKGVGLSACANTLRSRHLDTSALLDGVEVVSSGIGQVVRRQAEGWQYVRP